MQCCIAQGCLDKFRAFLWSNGIADRVVYARIEDDYHCQAVAVGGKVATLGLFRRLIKQLYGPTVKRPHQEWCRRTAALHLHGLVVAEIRHAKPSCARHDVQFLAPHAYCCRGYFLPTYAAGHMVVILSNTHVGKVVVVAQYRR